MPLKDGVQYMVNEGLWDYALLLATMAATLVALMVAISWAMGKRSGSMVALSVVALPPVMALASVWGRDAAHSGGLVAPSAFSTLIYPLTPLDLAIGVPAGVLVMGSLLGALRRSQSNTTMVLLVGVVILVIGAPLGWLLLTQFPTLSAVLRTLLHGCLAAFVVLTFIRIGFEQHALQTALSAAVILAFVVLALEATLVLESLRPVFGFDAETVASTRQLVPIGLGVSVLLGLVGVMIASRRYTAFVDADDWADLGDTATLSSSLPSRAAADVDVLDNVLETDHGDVPLVLQPNAPFSMGSTPDQRRMQAFVDAQLTRQNLSKTPPASDARSLHALFQQLTQGDVSGERPPWWKPRELAKFNAWASVRGLSKSEAMDRYIEVVARLEAAEKS